MIFVDACVAEDDTGTSAQRVQSRADDRAILIVDVDRSLTRRTYPRLVATSRIVKVNTVVDAERLAAALGVDDLRCILIMVSTAQRTLDVADNMTQTFPGVPVLLVCTGWPLASAVHEELAQSRHGQGLTPWAHAMENLPGRRRAATNRPW